MARVPRRTHRTGRRPDLQHLRRRVPCRMRRFAAKVVVRPGQKKPACVPACLAPKDRDPVDFRIECSNTGQTPIEVSASNRDDVLLIILSAVPPPKQSRYLDRTRDVHIPSSVNPIQSNQQVTDFTSAISAILLSEFEKPFNPTTVDADQKFLANILTNARHQRRPPKPRPPRQETGSSDVPELPRPPRLPPPHRHPATKESHGHRATMALAGAGVVTVRLVGDPGLDLRPDCSDETVLTVQCFMVLYLASYHCRARMR